MRSPILSAVAALVLSAGSLTAQPVAVSYTVTGSAGNWMLDFTVANNLVGAPPDMGVYMFGIQAPGSATTAQPAGWSKLGFTMSGLPSGNSYATSWIDPTFTGVKAGQTKSGFQIWLSNVTAPTSFKYYAFGWSQSLADKGEDWTNFNPSWEGTAQGSFPQVNIQQLEVPVTTTPEPSTYALMVAGLAAVGAVARRKRRA